MKQFILGCYEGWIQNHIPKDEMLSNCAIWTRVMREAFPELIHVGGYVRRNPKPKTMPTEDYWPTPLSAFNFNYHEYLITEDGDIVDPTKEQFDHVIGVDKWHYERWEEHLII